ncbi:flagellar brake protein [Kaarinaea lacus]
MAAEELALDIGDVLQMQFLPDESHARHYVKVIGYLPDRSLIVTTPHINGKVMLVREGQRVAIRIMSRVNIIAFTGSVLRSCARPYPYLHISYPEELQTLALRSAERVSFSTTAQVRESRLGAGASTPMTSVTVQDISTTGALLIHSAPLGEVKDLLSMYMPMQVANGEEKFNTVAIIRNVRERKTAEGQVEYLHGVEFQMAGRSDVIMLHAFVYEHIAKANE